MVFVQTKRKALGFIFLLFLLSIMIRLPTLNRPLSDHHEFNTAVILICLESWEAGGGASQFSFVPVLNYQNEGDRNYQSILSDKKGNTVYISFGPGWYILPALVSKFFAISASPLFLQVLNLCLHFISCVLIFFIIVKLYKERYVSNYIPHLIGTGIFIFSPELLWFMGNGYVTCGVAIPFILLATLFSLPLFLKPGSIMPGKLLLASLSLVIAIYCDWSAVFVAASFSIAALIHSRKNKNYLVVSLAYGAAVLLSIGLMILQFASYLGLDQTLRILTERFIFRSYGNDGHGPFFLPGWFSWFLLSRHFSILLAIIVSVIFLMRTRKHYYFLSSQAIRLFKILLAAFLCHNLVLLNWSAGHDFSVMNYSILLAITGGTLIYEAFPRYLTKILTLTLLLSIGEYYYFNRPGTYSRKGIRYDGYQSLGESLKKIADPKEIVFMNIETAPQITYYAKHGHRYAKNYEESVRIFRSASQEQAIWVEQKDFKIVQYRRLIKKQP